jgi:hypothetical protein
LLALLDLLELVGDGSFFVFDLHNGVGRLRRIVDDTGTELGVCRWLYCQRKYESEGGES